MTGEVWRMTGGEPVSCREKLRVLEDNEHELLALMQDAFEDAVLMGVDEVFARNRFAGLAASLRSPHR